MSTYLTLKQAAERLPGSWNDRSVSYAMNTGTATPSGVVKLRKVKIKGRNMTTVAWVDQYLADLETAYNAPTIASPNRSRPAAHQQARQSLAAEGLA